MDVINTQGQAREVSADFGRPRTSLNRGREDTALTLPVVSSHRLLIYLFTYLLI